MSKKKNRQFPELATFVEEYAKLRGLDYSRYSPYHLRIVDGGFCVLDIWTTARYYALTTDYHAMYKENPPVERGGEKGMIPTDKQLLYAWLDTFFYPEISD